MMSENNKSSVNRQGLCVTCIHADDCVYMRKSKSPVQQCNEFAVSCNQERPNRLSAAAITAAVVSESQDELYRGLCMNCDERKNCGPTKTRAGVWQCEEYK